MAAAASVAFAAAASAQVALYTFNQSAGTYAPITGTQICQGSSATIRDDESFALTMPFSFTFDGSTYSACNVTTNGLLSFGATAPGTTNYGGISAATAYNGAVAPFSRDLQSGFTFKGDRTLGSDLITNATSTGPIQVGDEVTGTGIPAGTTVLSISGNTVQMSAVATATSTATAVNSWGTWSDMRSDTLGSAPNRVFVVQWSGWKRFGTTLANVQDMTLNFQVRLYETSGRVEVVYGNCAPGATTTTTVIQVGLRGPNNTFATNVNNRLNVKATSDWATSTVGTVNTSGEVFNNAAPANVIPAGLTYTWDPPAGVQSTNTSYGAGCYTQSATWFEQFGTFDLPGTAVRLTPNGSGGYTMFPGTPTAFVHTVPGLALTDDSIGTLALPTPFTYPGGSTSSLDICSNGYIWAQTNALADFSPTQAELFSNPARFCPLWVDMLPDGAANLANVFAEVDTVNNKAYVTYVNVPTFTAGGTVNMQAEFDLGTGDVNYTYGAITVPAAVVSMAGWTPGTGFSTVNAGSVDVSASLAGTFSTTATEASALALSAAPTPVLGATVTYTTSNIPAAALISANLISLIQIPSGLPISVPAGCFAYVDANNSSTSLLFGGPTATMTFGVPSNAAFVGLPINVQSASLVLGINNLDAITSNGIRSVVGNY